MDRREGNRKEGSEEFNGEGAGSNRAMTIHPGIVYYLSTCGPAREWENSK